MNTKKELSKREEHRPEPTRERPLVAPPVDIYENAEELLVVVDVPGVTRENVTIDLNRDELTILARRPPEGRCDYYRRFLVPEGIDADKIGAELSRGVLRVHLPKSSSLRPRRIEVRAV